MPPLNGLPVWFRLMGNPLMCFRSNDNTVSEEGCSGRSQLHGTLWGPLLLRSKANKCWSKGQCFHWLDFAKLWCWTMAVWLNALLQTVFQIFLPLFAYVCKNLFFRINCITFVIILEIRSNLSTFYISYFYRLFRHRVSVAFHWQVAAAVSY